MDIYDVSSLVTTKKLEVKFQFDTGFGGYQPRIYQNDSSETAVTAFQYVSPLFSLTLSSNRHGYAQILLWKTENGNSPIFLNEKDANNIDQIYINDTQLIYVATLADQVYQVDSMLMCNFM